MLTRHLERKHLPRTTPESRRYRNSIRQVQRRVRQRHQPDLDLVFVRRHEVDAAITRKETRDRDKLHPAHRRRTRIPIRRYFLSIRLCCLGTSTRSKRSLPSNTGMVSSHTSRSALERLGRGRRKAPVIGSSTPRSCSLVTGIFWGLVVFGRRRNLRNSRHQKMKYEHQRVCRPLNTSTCRAMVAGPDLPSLPALVVPPLHL